ncbi:MAG: magnesium-translocating P-type ATPase, partial [Oscillospiraceae bacterium]
GNNKISHENKHTLLKCIISAFVNPFTAILVALAIVSLITDIIMVAPNDRNPITVIIIASMVIISGILRFIQETRVNNAAEKLSKMICTTSCIQRLENGKSEISIDEIVVGDIIYLSAGDMIPADIRLIYTKDLFVSQSALTGESEPAEKNSVCNISSSSLFECANLTFMGSNVISGSAKGVVITTGNDTMLGGMTSELSAKPPKTNFEKGVNSVSWLLIRFMLIMVPIVLFINGFTKGNWLNATLFAISVAVGLTPEMLPMLVTTCLAKGAIAMSHKKVIIRNLNAIQNLGSIDILCTDKTGTLTQDKVMLEYHLNLKGEEDLRVLRHAFLNSYYQTGLKNLMDIAIIEHMEKAENEKPSITKIENEYTRIDEIPFDFNRRKMSVVVSDAYGKTQMITKGAVEEMLKISAFVEYDGKIEPLTPLLKNIVLAKANALNENGMRVIAVAQKNDPSPIGAFSVADETNMVLIGYLAFFDPPKETTANAISALKKHGVDVKILTGDNEKVTQFICRKVGLSSKKLLLGSDIETLTDTQLEKLVEETTIFAKLSPSQKAKIIRTLRSNGHSVGYMGDGINDTIAMKASDVSISVDTAVDIAKESADIILLEKDLMILEQGIIEGRKTFANMIKYIKMTVSSNFGNMFSVLVSSAFLPFLPMASIHLILLNLIYDVSCVAIPWDNVDKEFLEKPRKFDASSISKFMFWIGPTSSVFDIATYLLMYFVICPAMCGGLLFNQISDPAMRSVYISIFQSGWFVESMWTQTLVLHMIRTPKIPFLESHASMPVMLLTFSGIILLTIIPFTPFGSAIGLSPLPMFYFVCLAEIVISYMCLATVMKKFYIKKYKELL